MSYQTPVGRRSTPCGVSLIGVFLILQGIFQIIAGILGVFGIIVVIFDPSRGGTLLAHGAISFILGIVSIIFAFGLFQLRRWAYLAVVIIAALNLIDSLYVLSATNFAAWGHVFNALFSVLILGYFLLDRNVRMAFRL